MLHHLQTAAPARNHSDATRSGHTVDRRIRAFLNGESHGEDVLGALYGHVAEEPVPERLRALLRH